MHAAPRAEHARKLNRQARFDRWLADSGVQRDDGAVGGWLDEGGVAPYVYPEIVGYYLQWLAWRASDGETDIVLAARAGAAQRWLRVWLAADGPPVTRVFADATQRDWRNHALFTFDLAMVLRGLASAARYRVLAPDTDVVAEICRLLESLIGADNELDAVRVHTPSANFPRRWSTTRGPFLAKAAAGISYAADALTGVPARLRDAAERTFVASVRALREQPHAETHPLLYAIEGYLNAPANADFAAHLPLVGGSFDRLVERCAALGRVPEATDDAGQARLDIVAQTLRAGALLAQHRCAAPPPFLRKLERALEDAITHDGAVPFVAGATPLQRNAWTTMFASQALAWARLDKRAMGDVAAAPLII
jgi:hypothetical protein